jgi:epoxyqueuosine reductase QueG
MAITERAELTAEQVRAITAQHTAELRELYEWMEAQVVEDDQWFAEHPGEQAAYEARVGAQMEEVLNVRLPAMLARWESDAVSLRAVRRRFNNPPGGKKQPVAS